jgi:PX domain
MDYSNVSNDLENPGGSSPWASTSPRVDRSTFQPTNDSSSSPLPAQQPSPQPQGNGSPTANRFPPVSTDLPTTSAVLASADDDTDSPDLSEQLQSAQLGDPDYLGDHEPNLYHQQQAQQYTAQQHRQTAARYQSGQRPQRSIPAYKLQAKITALERTGRKDPVLRFDVHVRQYYALTIARLTADHIQTNLPKFRTTQFRDVRRTHSEFVKIAHHLISSNPEAFVPAVPPSLTSAGAGTDEDEARVKASMQRWLNYVCGNDVLMRDEEMVFFVESDFGYSPVVNMKQPATGVRRKVLKQFAPPPDDTPELHEARPVVKLFYLATLDAHQKMEKMVKARRGTPTSIR